MKHKLFVSLAALFISLFSFSQVTFDWSYTIDCTTVPPEISISVLVFNTDGTITNLVCGGFDLINCSTEVGPPGSILISGDGTGSNSGSSTFTIDFTDSNGNWSSSFIIPAIVPLTFTFSTTDDCTGNAGEAAFLNTNIQMDWSNTWYDPNLAVIGTDVLSVSGLSPGTYVYSIIDNTCGDQYFDFFTIQGLNPVSFVTDDIVNPCPSSLGSISITASEGSGSYSYSWTGPTSYSSSTEDPTDIPFGGFYYLSIDDVDAPSCSLGATEIVVNQGDFNCDCWVSSSDILLFLADYGQSVANGANPFFDLNFDGLINSADLTILLANLGTNPCEY